jgi:3'-5' exoribonuclease
MKKQFVKDLITGNKVNDIFYVRERRALPRRDGGKFLIVELADKTGSVSGKIWDNIEEFMSEAIPGNFVKIQGEVSEYNNELQITVNNIQQIPDQDVSAQDFLQTSKYNIDKMYQELNRFINQIKDADYRKLLELMFADPTFVKQFSSAPASTGIHHGYLGGLLEHTLFMLKLSQSIPQVYPELDYSLLLTGIILHDIGKINSYTYDKVIDHTDQGKLIYHIVEGYRLTNDFINNQIPDFPEQKKQLLLHIILSHHGLREYGSPVTPKFAEAFIVHDLDNLDARVWMFRDITEKDKDRQWSDYHNFLETEVYIKRKDNK